MLLTCHARLYDDSQIENLCQCVKILGGKPCVKGNDVSVTYDGSNITADKFVELFENYPVHGVSIIE